MFDFDDLDEAEATQKKTSILRTRRAVEWSALTNMPGRSSGQKCTSIAQRNGHDSRGTYSGATRRCSSGEEQERTEERGIPSSSSESRLIGSTGRGCSG